jgi:cytochrome bd-type quinol oxidase subunit 2
MLAATMVGLYPFWLRSTIDLSYSLTASNAASSPHAMWVALWWWTIGIILVAGYFTHLFHSMKGKVRKDTEEIY